MKMVVIMSGIAGIVFLVVYLLAAIAVWQIGQYQRDEMIP